MRFDILNYPDKNIAMHCFTKDEAQTFLRYLSQVGRKWRDGTSYDAMDCYDSHNNNTCYYFNRGTYSNISNAISHGDTILEFKDFVWDEPEIDIADEDKAVFDDFIQNFVRYS